MNRTDITVIVSKDLTVGRTEDRPALILHNAIVYSDRRHGGRFVRFIRLPGVATCDGYRAVMDGGTVMVNAREAAAIFRRVCKGFADATVI